MTDKRDFYTIESDDDGNDNNNNSNNNNNNEYNIPTGLLSSQSDSLIQSDDDNDNDDDDDDSDGSDDSNDIYSLKEIGTNKVALARTIRKPYNTKSIEEEEEEEEKNVNSPSKPPIDLADYKKPRKGPLVKIIFMVFRHPISRNILPFLVMFLNFLIYNEDPISYSEQETKIYGCGRIFNYYFRQYPPISEPLWITLKVFSLFLWTTIGLLLGKYLIHDALLRDCFGLQLFRKDMGSWPVMAMTTSIVVFFGSYIYNTILRNHFYLKDGSDNHIYILNDYIGSKEYQFGKLAVTLTWLCDYFNVFVVNDTMLQDAYINPKRESKYGCNNLPMKKVQRFWHNYRKPVFYITTFMTLMITFFYMGSDWEYDWLVKRKGHFAWNQYQRAFLCSFLIVFDICMFMQDWDFPKFKRGGKNVKMLGCGDRAGCKSKRFQFKLEFNGKWINFGALIMLLILDTNLFVNQAFYVPADYTQLADRDGHVHNIFNEVNNNNNNNTDAIVNGTIIDEISIIYCGNMTPDMRTIIFLNDTNTITTNAMIKYKCFNVSESFNIVYTAQNGSFIASSIIPILIINAVCIGVFVYIFWQSRRSPLPSSSPLSCIKRFFTRYIESIDDNGSTEFVS